MTDHDARSPEISDEAVALATGRDWAQWRALLDARGCATQSHAAIARMLTAEGLVASPWWAQMIVVGYERLLGRRRLGETADVGFQLGVQRTLPLPPDAAWVLLCSPEGLSTWLAAGVPTLPGEKGEGGIGLDGTRYALRSRVEGQRLRLSWQPPGRETATTLQVSLEARKSGTAVRFHHEGLADAEERAAMKSRWEGVLARLTELARLAVR